MLTECLIHHERDDMIDLAVQMGRFVSRFNGCCKTVSKRPHQELVSRLRWCCNFWDCQCCSWLALTFVAKVITFPFALLTFGLVWLAIPIAVNMVMLKIADNATGDDMTIKGLLTLLGLSTTVTATSAIMNAIL